MKVTKIGSLSPAAETFLQSLQPKHLYAEGSDSEPSEEVHLMMANFEEPLSEDEHTAIKETIDNNKAILYFENVKSDHFPDNALIRTDADMCVIKSEAGGRVQHIFASGGQDGPLPGEKKETFEMELKEDEMVQETTEPTLGDSLAVSEISTGEDEPKTDIEIAMDWLVKLPTSNTYEVDPNLKNENPSRASGSFTKIINYNSNISGEASRTCAAAASFEIELVAIVSPKRCKMVRITSRESSVNVNMAFDNDDKRGDGTYEGVVIVYPGDKFIWDDRYNFRMPAGWRMDQHEPRTENADNSYNWSTGWNIGAEGAPDPKNPAKLSLSYSQTKQVQTGFKDFTLEDNTINDGYCYWRYVFTTAKKDESDLFTNWYTKSVKPFPSLATGTMVMKNEVVYEAPENENKKQWFYFNIGHQTLCASKVRIYDPLTPNVWKVEYSGWIGSLWGYFSIDMNRVVLPQKS